MTAATIIYMSSTFVSSRYQLYNMTCLVHCICHKRQKLSLGNLQHSYQCPIADSLLYTKGCAVRPEGVTQQLMRTSVSKLQLQHFAYKQNLPKMCQFALAFLCIWPSKVKNADNECWEFQPVNIMFYNTLQFIQIWQHFIL